jgi:NADPH:quinone reductase-like Zn-dependent oxidoreductase
VPRIIVAMAAGPVSSVFRDTKVNVPFWHANAAGDVALLGGLLETGALVPVIDSVRPLEEVADAFRRFGAQEHTGKIVLSVSS